MNPTPQTPGLFSKHRLEALIDGIFAVAMTLLVIELKLPEGLHLHTEAELIQAVVGTLGKFISWIISFFVLAIYWAGNQRLFHYVRHVDGKLVTLTLFFLAVCSLLPFASALSGQYGGAQMAQVLYSTVMLLMSWMALLCNRYVFRHPELCGDTAMPGPMYRAARLRTASLMAVALAAIVIAHVLPGAGNAAFLLMFFITKAARKVERQTA
jgi:uncharacterized membrane protein